MTERTLNVGLLGCGTIGGSVVRLLAEHGDDIALRAGCRVEISKVADRNQATWSDLPLDPSRLTTEAADVLNDPDVDIICELIGGVEPSRTFILEAFERGKPVVTANKELLANHGRELFDASDAKGLDLYFEAAVGGGIPLIRPMKESLVGERLTRVTGIVNGTTNYILTRMSEDDMSFADALAQAQDLGFAEKTNPTADVDGFDAAAKCAILASIAFNARVTAADVYREGISEVSADDIAFAKRLGYAVKLLAIAELDDGRIAVRVHPAMIPVHHPLAAVRDSYNAVFLEGGKIEQLMFYGRGAGGDPTSTAVVGDLVSVARNLISGSRGVGCTCFLDRSIRPMSEMRGQYFVRLDVTDKPGVLAQIAAVFGSKGVSIKSVVQEGKGEEAQLVFITHTANEGAVQESIQELRGSPVVAAVQSVLRVEAEE